LNKSLFIFSSVCLLSINAYAKGPGTYPAKLTCTALGDCIAGYPNFCEADFYFPVTVVIEQPENLQVNPYDPSEVLSAEELQTKVKLDFSQGDQYSFYFFDRDDMSALVEGPLDKIQGTYEDGFDWVNGYNTRAKFNIECTIGL
jgi:hypothetical protein